MSFLHLDPIILVKAFGYVGIFAIIFAESGLFFGFFLPGDSLLFSAGLLASQGALSIFMLLVLVPLAAIIGDSVGYWFGAKVGRKLFSRDNSFFFNKKHLVRAEEFYTTYGPRAIILARFVPIVRTFVPIFAGVAHMRYRRFIRYNIIGGLLWGVGVTALGYLLGATVPGIDRYVTLAILLIILVSFLPVVMEVVKARRRR
ncbi:MAG: DedA family protein [Minisyncoccota bacterium]